MCAYKLLLCSNFALLRSKTSLFIEQRHWILPSSEWQVGVFYIVVRVYYVLVRNEASLLVKQLVWILPSSEWQVWGVLYCSPRLFYLAEERSVSVSWATSLDSSFVRMTKLRFYIVLSVYFVLLRNEASLFIEQVVEILPWSERQSWV